MILHQQLLQPATGPLLPWLALHLPSLTLALCEPKGNRITITQVAPFPGEITSATPITPDTLFDIAADIRHHLTHVTTGISTDILPLSSLHTSHSALGTSSSSLASCVFESSVYLLVNSLDGTTPGILHTGDPTALYLADPKTSILGHAQHFRSTVDLTVEGWLYWWEDALAHFQKLTIEFAQSTGTPVPQEIQDAVRHI
jgi:hypothetical protein